MPTYEFRLPDGTIIERTFKMSDVPDEIPSPNGDGTAVRIISGGGGLLFKGSGFYLTDYGRNAHRTQGDAPKPSPASESSPAGKTETSSSGKSESAASGKTESSAAPAKEARETKTAPAPKADPKPSGGGSPDK